MSVIYSCVMDCDLKFFEQALLWAESLIRRAGVSPGQIVVHAIEGAAEEHVSALKNLGVQVVSVKPFDSRHVYSNKLAQLSSPALSNADVVVLCDCDLLFLAPIDNELSTDSARASQVDLPLPRTNMWERLHQEAGLEAPVFDGVTAWSGEPTPWNNCNGGLYILPRKVFHAIGPVWQKWDLWLIDRDHLMGAFRTYIDQMSFALAANELGIRVSHLPEDINVPTHHPTSPHKERTLAPRVLHHHGLVDEKGLLKAPTVPVIQSAVRDANALIELIRKSRRRGKAAAWFAGAFRRYWPALAIATALVVLRAVLQIRLGLNLFDEGYLWYGAQRVLAGEVPIRDFSAYEPARYYITALPMFALNSPGIIAARMGIAIFEWLGLVIAGVALSRQRVRPNWFWIASCLAVLLLWFAPRHKSFDITPSIWLVAALALVLQRPGRLSFAIAGLGMGLALTMGKSHGAYGAAAMLSGLVYLRVARPSVPSLHWVPHALLGMLVGYAPTLLMAAFIPGFGAALLKSATILFEQGTNVPIPVPWAWNLPPGYTASEFMEGWFYVAILVFALGGLIYVGIRALRRNEAEPLLVASVLVGLPYLHYTFSRADLTHLALGIPPALIGAMALLSAMKLRWRIAPFALFAASSFFAIQPKQPGLGLPPLIRKIEVLGDELLVEPGVAPTVQNLQLLADKYVPPGGTCFIGPLCPGGYAVINRKAAVYDYYPLFPRSREYQLEEIEQLKRLKPGFALIMDFKLDGTDKVFYSNTHPLTYEYFRSTMVEVPSPDFRLPSELLVPPEDKE